MLRVPKVVSYLIDALKKAERDRHARRDASLRSAAASDSPARGRLGQRLLIAALVLLVLVNALLLFRMWQPSSDSPRTKTGAALPAAGSPTSPNAGEQASPSVPSVQGSIERARTAASSPDSAAPPSTGSAGAAASSSARVDLSENRDFGSLRLSDEPSGQAASGRSSSARDNSTPRPSSPPDNRAESTVQTDGGGSVRYSSEPLSDDTPEAGVSSNQQAEPDPDDNLLNQAQIPGAPQIDINGQLYSSVPGRSFILVDGRRYHEGEKLSEGPAIERITPTGATLRYRGKRYHVEGPGGG